MHEKLLRGLQFFVCGVMIALICGVATPAQGQQSPATGNIDNAYLTKVLSLKDGVQVNDDQANDSYEFTFTGDGTVNASLVSGGVQQVAPLEENDVVPKLGDANGKVTLYATNVDTANNATHKNGNDDSTFIYVIRKPISDIVAGVTFAKPGIYTYRVTETGVNKVVSDSNVGITQSKASYIMMVTVKHDDATDSNVPTNIDVRKEADDEGNTEGTDVYPQNQQKVDPAYPMVDTNDDTLINIDATLPENIAQSDLAPDSRGRNVYGFTFANEYVIGKAFNLKKEVGGDFGDRNKTFDVSVTFEDSAAPDNCRYVYQVFTYNRDANTWTGGSRKAAYFSNQTATITETLKDSEYISVIGVQGYNINDKSKVDDVSDSDLSPTYVGRSWLGNGVVPNTTYTVQEGAYEHYKAKITTFDDNSPKTLTSSTTTNNPKVLKSALVNTAISTSTKTDSTDKTVIVLNTYDDASTNPTGIIINNLPYVLLIGIPVAVFAVMFVSRRRNNDAAA